MSELDLVLVKASDGNTGGGEGTDFEVTPQSLGDDTDELARVWPSLIGKLAKIIDSTDADFTSERGFGLESVQFQIGIEGGFNFGLTGGAKAAITATFARRPPAG